MTEPSTEVREFLASMAIYQEGDKVIAVVRQGDEPEEEIEVPPHVAAMLPMGIQQIRSVAQ